MAFVRFRPISTTFRFYSILKNDKLISEFVHPQEKVVMAFKSRRDIGVFTDKRIILIDYKGINGPRKSVYAIEYSNVSSYVLNIHAFSSSIDFVTKSSHELRMRFLKSISLEDVNMIYKYLTDCLIKE
ncbi:MAG: PH domain-containing protein [Bacilli bacterium]|jgi:hypothetical protein